MTCSTRIPIKRLLLISLLAFSTHYSPAQAPLGESTFSFDSAVLPLWDFSGTFSPTNGTINGAAGQQVPFASAVDLTHDGTGRLKGSGITALGVGNDFLAATYKASGRVSGGGSGTTVNLTTRFKGSGVISGANTTFNIVVNYKLGVNSADGTLTGTARGSASFSAFGGGRVDSDVAVPIPAGTNASWTLQLNTTPVGHVAGTGNIILADSRVLPGNVKGNFSKQSNLTKLKFTGINDAKGSSLNLQIASGILTNELVSLKGKVLGQKLTQ